MAIAMSPLPRVGYSYEIEQELRPALQRIHQEKKERLGAGRVVLLTLREMKEDAKQKPWGTAAKTAFFLAACTCLHPLVLGSIACTNIYRIQMWDDLYSENINTANTATQLYSNLGHAVGYLAEGIEVMAVASALLARGCYRRAAAEAVGQIYDREIGLSEDSTHREFLWELKQREMGEYGIVGCVPMKEVISEPAV